MIDPGAISHRGVLAGAGAATALAAGSAKAQAAIANPAGLRLLKSTDGVFTPPRGGARMKFSFSSPEPSVEFAGLVFGFEAISFENNYGIDPALTRVRREGDGLSLTASGFTWAGARADAPDR